MIQHSTVQALMDEAGLPAERVQGITIQPGTVRFTVYSVDPVSPGLYLTAGKPRTHFVEHVIGQREEVQP